MQATLSSFLFYENRLTNELDQNVSWENYDFAFNYFDNKDDDNKTTSVC